jgi:hypothetical protein
MNYSFHPHAERELEEVEKYYDNIREELGDRFRAETEMAISRILDFPNAWQRLSQNTRRRVQDSRCHWPNGLRCNASCWLRRVLD